MGTIIERPRKDGSTAYLAQVRARRNNRVAHTESKTFPRKGDAEAWVKRREGEFAAAGDDLRALKQRKRTLGDAIDFYVRDSEKEIGRTKAQVLQVIRRYEIAGLPCAEVASSEIVAFAKLLAKEGRGPATVQNYLSHLSAVFHKRLPLRLGRRGSHAGYRSVTGTTRLVGSAHFQAIHHLRPSIHPLILDFS